MAAPPTPSSSISFNGSIHNSFQEDINFGPPPAKRLKFIAESPTKGVESRAITPLTLDGMIKGFFKRNKEANMIRRERTAELKAQKIERDRRNKPRRKFFAPPPTYPLTPLPSPIRQRRARDERRNGGPQFTIYEDRDSLHEITDYATRHFPSYISDSEDDKENWSDDNDGTLVEIINEADRNMLARTPLRTPTPPRANEDAELREPIPFNLGRHTVLTGRIPMFTRVNDEHRNDGTEVNITIAGATIFPIDDEIRRTVELVDAVLANPTLGDQTLIDATNEPYGHSNWPYLPTEEELRQAMRENRAYLARTHPDLDLDLIYEDASSTERDEAFRAVADAYLSGMSSSDEEA